MVSVVVRLATTEDVAELAQLRWEWSQIGREPIHPTADQLDDTASILREWMSGLGDRVICAVAQSEESLVGVAWLVLYDRVPGPLAGERLTGDVQSVFVRESHRNAGLGSRLVELLLAHVADRPVGTITVHANDRARGFYRRLGFNGSELLLERRR